MEGESERGTRDEVGAERTMREYGNEQSHQTQLMDESFKVLGGYSAL
jgi:hypothetical protein